MSGVGEERDVSWVISVWITYAGVTVKDHAMEVLLARFPDQKIVWTMIDWIEMIIMLSSWVKS